MLSNIDCSRYHSVTVAQPLTVLQQCATPLAGSGLGEEEAVELERLFAVLADRQRLRMVDMLGRAGGQAVCVCEFVDALAIAQPTVSYHLKKLAAAGLVTRERRGSFVYTQLAEGALEKVARLLAPAGLGGPAADPWGAA